MSFLLSTHSQVFVLLLALGLGTLMGLRRELDAQSQKEKDHSFMGVRTTILFTVLGVLSTFFPNIPVFPLFVFSGDSVLLAVVYANGAFFKKCIGLTSELSVLAMVLFWKTEKVAKNILYE